MVAPKKSLRPKSREQVGVENQVRQFGNLEFRADMDEQLKWNPLARLGFEPDQSVVGRPRYNSPDIHEGIRYPYYAEQEYIDETLPGAASGVEYTDVAGRVKPGSVVVNSNTAKNPVWSHEYTHGGIEKVIEYLNEDREFFTEKYGKDTVKLLDAIQTDTDRTKGPNEKLTEMLDDVSKDAEVDIHGHLIPAAGTALGGMDSTRTAVEDVSSRASLQEYLKKGRVSDNLSGRASFEASFPGYPGIFKAAEDMLEKQGETLPSEKRGWWERKTRKWLSGNGLFNEGGDVASQTEEALGWTAEGKKFADENPVEVAEEEPTALSIADVPVFDRPMDASESDKWTGVQDELGNRQYKTIFGRTYFVRPADDQRTNYEKIQQDIIPAVKNYLDNPTAPSREQTIDFLKQSLGAAWETFKIPGDLAAGNKGMEDVTLGNIFELAGGTGVASTVGKVPGDSSNTTRIFGGPGAKDYRNRALQKAAQMRSEGASPEKIEEVTGRVATASPGSETSVGFSNQFKFEIPDVDIKIENPIINYAKANGLTAKESLEQVTNKSGEGFRLTHFIPSHSELFKQYPDIKNVIVNFMDDSNYSGLYSPSHNSISISTELFEGGVNSPQFRSTFFHELQHAVQARDAIETGMNFIANNPVENIKVLKKTRKDSSANKMFEVHLERDKKLLQTRGELLALGEEILKNPNSKKVSKKLAYKYAQLKDELYLNYLRFGKEVEARIVGARASDTQGRSVVEERAEQLPDRVEFNYKIKKPPNFLNRLSKKLGLNRKLTPESEQEYLNEAIDFITDYTREEDYSIAKAMMKSLKNKEPDQGFAQGGVVDMSNQMEMLFNEGGIADDGMRRDPVSGNEIPPGSLAEEVRDDIPAQLSEGEYVVPADVVRFFGVKYFEDLRAEAKMGLVNMEANGRIGGEPILDPMANQITDQDLAQLDQMLATGVANGGLMDKMAFAAKNDKVINQRMNQGGFIVGYAEGGTVTEPSASYADPTRVDQVISRVMEVIQQKPELIQELSKRGIQVSRTNPTMQAQQMDKANPPAEASKAFADGGFNTNYQSNSTGLPDYYSTPGGSYTYQGPGVPSAPVTSVDPVEAVGVAPAKNAQEACTAMGMGYDPITGTCVLVSNDDSGPVAAPKTPEFKFEEPDVDYFKMSEEELAAIGTGAKIDPLMNKLGLGAALVSGPLGLVVGGYNAYQQGKAISEVRSAALVAKARGFDDLADTLRKQADDLVGKSSFLVQAANTFGGLSGINDFSQQIAAFSPKDFNVGLNLKMFDGDEKAYLAAIRGADEAISKRGVSTAKEQRARLSDPVKLKEARDKAAAYKAEKANKKPTVVTASSLANNDNNTAHQEMMDSAMKQTTDVGGHTVTERTYGGDTFGADEDGVYKGGLMTKKRKKK
jgi:hypothetical protein